MSFTDQIIACANCETEFAFSAEEQEFYAQKGFAAPPKRCKPCREAQKAQRASGGGAPGGQPGGYSSGPRSFGSDRPRSPRPGGDREMFDVICDQCGQATQVPFKPNGSKPVLCRDCFRR
jgi:CxxC-x17-CxxC domain-containing protein